MNRIKGKVFFIVSLLLMLISYKSVYAKSNPAKFIRSITTKAQKENVLRVDMEIDFRKPADFSIEYWKNGDDDSKHTTRVRHSEKGKTKITLVFLEADTKYNFRIFANNARKNVVSNVYQFTTPALPSEVPTYFVEKDSLLKKVPGYLILGRSHQKPGFITIINTEGKVVWYQNMKDDLVLVADFDSIHQTIQCNVGRQRGDKYTGRDIIVMDLLGNVLLKKDVSSLFVHHEIRRMPDGNLLLINYVPRQFDLTKHGGTTNETVYGDGITIMDMLGNIVWKWDCFSERNPMDDSFIMRSAIWQWDDDKDNVKYNKDLGRGMSGNPLKDDWLHANSVNYDTNGDFYISFNNISEIWKVIKESKKVAYRLGRSGNLKMMGNSSMSGVHCVNVLEKDKLLFLDNGCSTQQSKVLEYTIDSLAKTAKMEYEVRLPTSLSTQNRGGVSLVNNETLIINSTTSTSIIFTDLKGNILRIIKTPHQTYRASYIPPFDY